jgi:putative sigma-54 modulation protein
MNIVTSSIGFTASDNLNAFISKKIAKLYRHSNDIIKTEVILEKGAENNPFNEWCKITISMWGENPFVKKNAASYEEAILKAVEAMDKKLRRMKTKRVNTRNDI